MIEADDPFRLAGTADDFALRRKDAPPSRFERQAREQIGRQVEAAKARLLDGDAEAVLHEALYRAWFLSVYSAEHHRTTHPPTVDVATALALIELHRRTRP